MANKYKVGDRVKLVGWKESVSGKKGYYGKIFTIRDVCDGREYPYLLTGDPFYAYRDEELEPACENKIVITTDGVTTLARLYDGSKVIKSAEAKCSPKDTFDFAVGAKLAYDRLMEEKAESVKPVESLENVTWKVVDRPVKAGDYVRITRPSYSFDVKGDILKVHRPQGSGILVLDKDLPHRDGKNLPTFEWNYCDYEYEVVEKVEKPTYKPGDKVRIIANTCCHHMKVGDIITLRDNGVWGNSDNWHYYEHLGYIYERDFEPYVPVVVNGFKVGDRVNYMDCNGTIICIAYDETIGVEFDNNKIGFHNCECELLRDGKPGTKCTSYWLSPTDVDLKHGEIKGYNGKVVCVKSRDEDFKVGKVYEMTNGVMYDEHGHKRPEPNNPDRRIESLDDWWSNGSNLYKFIPYVE